MRHAVAVSPGHATLIFGKYDGGSIEESGSFGAGMSLYPGAESEVFHDVNGGEKTEIIVENNDGRIIENKDTSLSAISILRKKLSISGSITVRTRLHLPLSQGFGMSAAGTMSACCALSFICGGSELDAVKAAHAAEIQCGTGLGDVAGIMCGGLTARRKGGLPPACLPFVFPFEGEVLLAVVGPEIKTDSVIRGKMEKITASAAEAMKDIEGMEISGVFNRARRFANDSGLITPEVREALAMLGEESASMVMIGNAVIMLGNNQTIELPHAWRIFRARTDREGPRILRAGGRN
ncbi:MAG: hypothetical protein QXP70_01070 [Methanomassiliicoccales archaeon]